MFSDLCPPPSRQPYSFSRGDNRESRSNSSSPLSHAFVLTRSPRIKEPLARRLFLSRAHQRSPREPCLPRAPRQTTRGGGERRRAVWRMGRWTAEELLRETLPLVDLSNLGRVVGKSRAQQRPLGAAFLGAYEVATAEERPRMGKELSKGSGTHQSRCSSPAVVVASAQEVAVARTSRSRLLLQPRRQGGSLI